MFVFPFYLFFICACVVIYETKEEHRHKVKDSLKFYRYQYKNREKKKQSIRLKNCFSLFEYTTGTGYIQKSCLKMWHNLHKYIHIHMLDVYTKYAFYKDKGFVFCWFDCDCWQKYSMDYVSVKKHKRIE